ncbi:AraC family transcriptional regulator [Xylophilus sp. GOD-11R]|uniref:AraC family transcriptional regulator n=1 Tax=Xylophilus sp. GOD-11R TaxID=3089814 RepID=UPI00298C6BB7|nr:AraC family transcriptional regulator [Xylophilus sp. GOD-11R]WPB59394.1 AraC family transcriptional regulator [Xylophilus sp. GOD-11R]
MAALLLRLAPAEGYTATTVPGVRLLRSNRPLQTTPVLYEPGIVFVCQGRKTGFWGDRRYVYDAQHYLAVAVPVPFTMETEASAEEPLLAVYLGLDLALVAELTSQLDGLLGAPQAAPATMLSTPIDDTLADAVLRLLQALASPVESAILAPGIVREICFRVLCGEQGHALRAALSGTGRVARIGRAVRRIHTAYREPLQIDALAGEADMSVSTFHLHFRQVTDSSPLQYLKSIRLHKARLLMLRENMTAAAAAARVGYESPSQFGREFKRLFGRSPALETDRLRGAYAMPAMPWAEDWVSSH